MYGSCLDKEIKISNNIGENVLIPRIDLVLSNISLLFSCKRQKFRIRLAFSLAINRAQDQTFDKVRYISQNLHSAMHMCGFFKS